ncbi:hypothetical protein [Rathayibacter soli]|uniref:hypothetical protein n=1 Tax=Rathayibacter soli TaxID=3144168 RepID=UPI0027E4E16D|nr:hypothetical protein [Glaciibacter superstes]
MSDPEAPGYAASYRVLSGRTDDETRAQLEVLAQLNNRSVTTETRFALESWVERSKTDPAIKERAEAARAEIEREAQTKRNAIAAIFGGGAVSAPSSQSRPSSSARSTKQADQA